MRAPKAYGASALIVIFTLAAAGYAQRSTPQKGPAMINGRDADPQPSNSEVRTAGGASHDPTNHPGQATAGNMPKLPHLARPLPIGAKPPSGAKPSAGDMISPLTIPAPESQATVPQSEFYEFLFDNMALLNKVADRDDKARKHKMAALWRTHDQRAAGLNDAEGEILQEIALDCNRAVKDQDAKIEAFLQKAQAKLVPGVLAPDSPELAQMLEDRKAIINTHIERLREALGGGPFQKLDHYVRSTFRPHVIIGKHAPPSTAGTSKDHKENQ